MNEIDAGLIRLYRWLESSGAPLMVGGAIASIHFGEPRTILDIDVIIDAGVADAARFVEAFDAERSYVPPVDTIRAELGRGASGHFNIIDIESAMKADVYPAGDDHLIRYGLEHVVQGELSGSRSDSPRRPMSWR